MVYLGCWESCGSEVIDGLNIKTISAKCKWYLADYRFDNITGGVNLVCVNLYFIIGF